MFDHIGSKIKSYSMIMFTLGVISGIIGAAAAYPSSRTSLAGIVITFLPIVMLIALLFTAGILIGIYLIKK